MFDYYEAASAWLREDEYELVEGRWSADGPGRQYSASSEPCT